MNKRWDDLAWDQYVAWQLEDEKTIARINKLVKDIERNGAANGIGKSERLKHRNTWSRRIDAHNRLVYRFDEYGFLYILSCRGHYDE